MAEQFFKDASLKATAQRREILQALREAARPLTAEEIHATLAANGANLSTVYRTLATLTQKGLLIKTVRQNGTADYQPGGEHHCHEMVCTHCGERAPLPGCPLREMSRRLEAATGYHVTGHSLEFTGVCPRCQKKDEH